MREPERHELNSTYIVVLSNDELILLKKYHEKEIGPAEEKFDKFKDRYMDIVKTDYYYKKMEELSSKYFYHSNSLFIIRSLIK
jgi:hypothetical protein